jgi:hypothetical protein
MFKKRILFIIGAGASCEFGLPIGPALANAIADKVNITAREFGEETRTGDPEIISQLQRRNHQFLNQYITAAHTIRDGVRFASSIDDFLDLHSTNEFVKTVGKIAIVKSILEQERRSNLYFDKSNIYNTMKVSSFEDTWLIKFVRMLGRGVPKEAVGNIFNKVAFICFNYDRCIEQTLYHALQQLYSIDSRQAGEILKKLDIIHPYGMVGDLKTDVQNGVAFGGDPHRLSEDYSALSDRIKTYTEQVEDEYLLEQIHEHMHKAERIVFLGFAFHDQNMKLLKPKDGLKKKEIYGTAFGMSDSDVTVIRHQLLSFFKDGSDREVMDVRPNEIRNDLKCADLFDQYTRSLPA